MEITLQYKQKEIDLYVSKQITLGRLKQLLWDAFRENGVLLPESYALHLEDKPCMLGDYDRLLDFGLQNGDKYIIY